MAKKGKINRGTLNYIVDIAIGIGFLTAMLSGIVFLFYPSGGGFQGGRNTYFAATILGMDRWFLKDLHTWSSILMGLGVLGHIVLHWNWFVCMTKNIFARRRQIQHAAAKVGTGNDEGHTAAEVCRREC